MHGAEELEFDFVFFCSTFWDRNRHDVQDMVIKNLDK
jgi:hypothetical protein